jgi:hypothetical protein
MRVPNWCVEPCASRAIGAGMTRRLITLLTLLLFGAAMTAHAQRTTERYIPLGQSPGISGKLTLIGTVGGVDSGAIVVQSAAGTQRVKLTDATRLWLDRSAAQQSTAAATAADLRPGRRIEVKFSDDSARTTAEWIKIDAAAP